MVQQPRIIKKKTKEKYDNKGGKEKAAKYYKGDKDVFKEKARNKYKNLTEGEKELKRQYSRDRYKKLKKNYYASKNNSFSQYKGGVNRHQNSIILKSIKRLLCF